MTKVVIYFVLWPVIIFPGIFGNVLSLFVVRRTTEDSSSTSKFLCSLAVADTMTLIARAAQMFYTIGEIISPCQFLTWKLSPYTFHRWALLPERISKGITVAIVSDRVVSLAAPLRYRVSCRPKRITIIIVMVYVIIATTSVPFLVYKLIIGENNRTVVTNVGKQDIASKQQGSQPKFTPYHLLINVLVFDSLPIPIVFVFNIIIIISLRNSEAVKTTTIEIQHERKQQERKLTKLLLTISTLFLVFTGPSAVYSFVFVARLFSGAQVIGGVADILVTDILVTLALINNSINFILYAVMNKKYRDGFIAVLHCCRRCEDIDDAN